MAEPDLVIGISDSNKKALAYENGQLTGSFSDMFECQLKVMHHSYEVQVYPQIRLLLELQKGTIDMAMPLAQTPSRDRYAIFSDTVLEVGFTLLSKEAVTDIHNLEDITFATLRSGSYNDILISRGANITEVNSYDQAFQMVQKERLDAVVIPTPLLLAFKDLAIGLNTQELKPQKVGYYINAEQPKIASLLNKAIKECFANK